MINCAQTESKQVNILRNRKVHNNNNRIPIVTMTRRNLISKKKPRNDGNQFLCSHARIHTCHEGTIIIALLRDFFLVLFLFQQIANKIEAKTMN